MHTRLAITWLIAIATLVVRAGVVDASSGYRLLNVRTSVN